MTLETFAPLWDELFPAEQARIVTLLVERVDVKANRVEIRLRMAGLSSLVAELCAADPKAKSHELGEDCESGKAVKPARDRKRKSEDYTARRAA